ncbi:MAG: M23 family metallopeptidase [Bacillota bacterium]|nr:M23 family metallopeptidase [Bacillota bacterium]
MRQDKDKKKKDKPAVALMLCFCIMALVSFFAVKANIDKVRSGMDENNAADVVKEKSVDESSSIVDSADNSGNDESNSSGSTGEGSDSEYTAPLSGEIIMKYSMDMPIYWKTLDQYMTHGGIDIAAPAGSTVKACASGTVTRTGEDDRFGIIVEVNHGNGITAVYGNLSADDLVETGDVVQQGDTIGKVGQSSMFEFDSEPHLHFEMKKDGSAVDPGSYIDFR